MMDEMGAWMAEKGGLERGKAGADSGFRGGDCHAENGVLMVAIATILGKKFFLLW